ncbi:MAG: PHP domain-containing protein [Deltaproteobacteria bacterium]|nr:PHP domain-containing protein [Deltaproteobacteria bacterium]
MNLKKFSADLHIHTCLSPCASLDLSPRNIVEQARKQKLDLIAVTDHNTGKNVKGVMNLGEKYQLSVIPGMEVQTREEIHLLTLFPDWRALAAWDEEVRSHLPDIKNEPEFFGDQPVVDEEGKILQFEDRLLLNSIDLSLNEIMNRVDVQGGMTIPAHFDRKSFSLISQLGFIPEDLDLEALEITRTRGASAQGTPLDAPVSIPRIVCSDAHQLEDVGRARTIFLLAEPTFKELRLAFRGQGGRKILETIFQDRSE